MPRRIIVAALPHLAAEHRLRAEGLTGLAAPFALAHPMGGALRVASTNLAATAAGIAPGMGLADARALVPDLATRAAEPERLALFWRALERWAARFSPIVGRDRGLVALPAPAAPATTAGDGRAPVERRVAARRQRHGGALAEAGALVIDATGATHLFGGEGAMLEAVVAGLEALGLTATAAMADSRGAAWALAHHGAGTRTRIVAPGRAREALAGLGPAALRLDRATVEGLEAVGLTRIGDIAGLPRGQLARRFGLEVIRRLDQALGLEPEPVAPTRAAPHFATRLTLAEPIGLTADVVAGLDRLLERLCARLEAEGRGARALTLTARRVDGADQTATIRLARPMRDPMRLRALFEPKVDAIEAGYGIDALRLAAPETEPLNPMQAAPAMAPAAAAYGARPTDGEARAVPRASPASAAHARAREAERLADLVTRIANRIGFENVTRFLPAESHIPERAFLVASAGHAEPGDWSAARGGHGPVRPLVLFPPEPVMPLALAARAPAPAPDPDPDPAPAGPPGAGVTANPHDVPNGAPAAPRPANGAATGPRARPPHRFRWRGRRLTVLAAEGPERIAPEWWWDDPAWTTGPRDYWRVATAEGPRLWLFHTPAAARPDWSVHGTFA
ncbi:MAG: DNA polymerase Y family protein [Pseudomonadota bacterium]